MISVTSFRFIRRISKIEPALLPSIGCSSNSSGITGRQSNFHGSVLPSAVWQALLDQVTDRRGDDVAVVFEVILLLSNFDDPRDRRRGRGARSFATLGFSAMMSDLDIFDIKV